MKDVAPGTLVPRKLKAFWPEIVPLPEAVGALALEIVAELQRVLVVDVVEIVLQRPQRLIRPVPGCAAPTAELGERDDAACSRRNPPRSGCRSLALPPAERFGVPSYLLNWFAPTEM